MSDTVTIGDRTFRIGASYAPKQPDGCQPKQLLGYSPKSKLVSIGSKTPRSESATLTTADWFAAWAGDEVQE